MKKAQAKPKSSPKLSAIPKITYFVSDQNGKYKATKPLTAEQIIKAAETLLNERFKPGYEFNRPEAGRDWLRFEYQDLEHEIFSCLFLDNQNRLIANEVLFRGTVDAASVYPREVVKRALQLNAGAVIFAHNHPSGETTPSHNDQSITKKLEECLSLFSIRTLDHFIVGKQGVYSFAEHGLI